MYCEYLEFYFPKVCYFLLIGLLEFCYFSFQHDSDHSFSSVLSLLGLSLGLVKSVSASLCSDQTSDISGPPKEDSGQRVWYGPAGHLGRYQHPHFVNISQRNPLCTLQVKSCHGLPCLP